MPIVPDDELRGKTALVTGAARRLGRSVALALAQAGAHVVVHYRNAQRDAEDTAEAVRACGVNAWLVAADLVEPGGPERLMDNALACAGSLDCLVNNAGFFPQDRLDDVLPQAILDSIRINALAPFVLARRFAEQGRPGAIVNFLDARMNDYDREHVAYHLGKRMSFAFTRMMALEFAPAIRVNAVAPGLILPPEGRDETYLAQLASTNPLNCHGGPDDVTDAVLFLLRARFVTGQAIFVDGGRHMKGSVYGC